MRAAFLLNPFFGLELGLGKVFPFKPFLWARAFCLEAKLKNVIFLMLIFVLPVVVSRFRPVVVFILCFQLWFLVLIFVLPVVVSGAHFLVSGARFRPVVVFLVLDFVQLWFFWCSISSSCGFSGARFRPAVVFWCSFCWVQSCSGSLRHQICDFSGARFRPVVVFLVFIFVLPVVVSGARFRPVVVFLVLDFVQLRFFWRSILTIPGS